VAAGKNHAPDGIVCHISCYCSKFYCGERSR